MRKHFFLAALLLGWTIVATAHADSISEARGVIERRFGAGALQNVTFEALPTSPTDVYEYQSAGGKLTVRGSSPVALASGYYQFIRHTGLGIASWSGNRLDLSKPWPDTALTRVESPYAYRYYFNVVTMGYTTPYWTWDRWQQEIDWMALHGINMPLALNATEAIGTRVWKKMGLTDAEIGEFYTAPGHLPWQRMGNMAKLDGPLSETWHNDQIALQHQILDRERALGMHPIVLGFAGFVPPALPRVREGVKLQRLPWGGFHGDYLNNILSPDAPCFSEIGKLTIEEWEKEFGKNEMWLCDSFNEMPLPKSDDRNTMLTRYGKVIYDAIKSADPDAVWVMQGWMFGYDSRTWTHDALQALMKEVPDDKMIILDEAIDYNHSMWGGKFHWDRFDGFFNKRWVAGYIPNMGGKSMYTGKIDFYAKGGSIAWESPNHGRLSGFGIVPEGIENNEVLYELIADLNWSAKPADLDQWIPTYCQSRYGACPDSIKQAWKLMRETVYSRLHDHPRFNWQLNPGTRNATMKIELKFIEAAALYAQASELKDNPLYRADLAEITALAAGMRVNELFRMAMEAQDVGDAETRKAMAAEGLELLGRIDKVLASHPNLKLQNWIDHARANGHTPEEKDHYEANAKLLIALWGHNGEINDYSARVWSGLIGTYYIPRWQKFFANMDTDTKENIRDFEKAWTDTPSKLDNTPSADPVAAASELAQLINKPLPAGAKVQTAPVAEWKSGQLTTEWTQHTWPIKGEMLTPTTLLRFSYTSGSHRLEMRNVRILEDKQPLATDKHAGQTGLDNSGNQYRLTIEGPIDPQKTYTLQAEVRTDGGNDSNGQLLIVKKK